MRVTCSASSASIPAYRAAAGESRGKRIVGPALTVRNIAHATQIHKAAHDKASGQGETEAHNLASPATCSSSKASWAAPTWAANRRRSAGVKVKSAPLSTARCATRINIGQMGWPVWCRGFSPITGKWRMQTVEVNGTVHDRRHWRYGQAISSAQTKPAIAFVPYARAAQAVLEASRKIDGGDTKRKGGHRQRRAARQKSCSANTSEICHRDALHEVQKQSITSSSFAFAFPV